VELGKFESGVETFKELIREYPKDASLHFSLGSLYNQMGNKIGALGEYKNLKKLKSDKLANDLFSEIYK
jgi:DNA-binding SARP family transcriptional activator